MKSKKQFGYLIIGLCFVVIGLSAFWAGSAWQSIPGLKWPVSTPAPTPPSPPIDRVSLDQVAEALEAAGLMNPDFKPAMIRVEGGRLPKGSELEGTLVDSFQIGKYEVTCGEWEKVQKWAIQPQNGYDLNQTDRSSNPQNPVMDVSWFDALKWCNARSEMEGLTPVYEVDGGIYKTGETVPWVNHSANGYRLPTDAEWEWAARGGPASRGFLYSGSDEVNEVAWHFGSFVAQGTKAVGTKSENELGLHDMSGNVFEWCWDSPSHQIPVRRIRGGCWAYHADQCAVRTRGNAVHPGVRLMLIGFRVAQNEG